MLDARPKPENVKNAERRACINGQPNKFLQPDSRTGDFSRPRGYQSLIVHRRNLSRFKFPFDRSLLPRNRSSSRGQCYRSDVRENGNNEIRTNLSFSILGSLISVITNDPPKHHSLSLSLAFYATFIS